jgi:hypothetical protein
MKRPLRVAIAGCGSIAAKRTPTPAPGAHAAGPCAEMREGLAREALA